MHDTSSSFELYCELYQSFDEQQKTLYEFYQKRESFYHLVQELSHKVRYDNSDHLDNLKKELAQAKASLQDLDLQLDQLEEAFEEETKQSLRIKLLTELPLILPQEKTTIYKLLAKEHEITQTTQSIEKVKKSLPQIEASLQRLSHVLLAPKSLLNRLFFTSDHVTFTNSGHQIIEKLQEISQTTSLPDVAKIIIEFTSSFSVVSFSKKSMKRQQWLEALEQRVVLSIKRELSRQEEILQSENDLLEQDLKRLLHHALDARQR